MVPEVWILGGAGRSGRAIAAELMSRGVTPVLTGRDATRLTAAAQVAARLAQATEQAGDGRTLVVGSVGELAERIREQQPAVVINTIGPFTATAAPIIRACLPARGLPGSGLPARGLPARGLPARGLPARGLPASDLPTTDLPASGLPGSDYIDLANDAAAVSATLGLNQLATDAGRTVVTGAGFGVTATESVVVKLIQDQPAPSGPASAPGRAVPVRVRVDMIPSLAIEAGPIGPALAGGILDGLPGVPGGGRYQGRRYENGRLAPARLGGDVAHLVVPDGAEVTTASMPLGELIAAQRSGPAERPT